MTREEREDAINFFKEVAEKEVNNAKYSKLAIEALEQQTCEDCISRQAVLDKIYNVDGMEALENSNIFAKHYADMIKSLPSVTPKKKTEWIPVSERLPEFNQDVLLSLRSLDIKTGFRAQTEPYFYCHDVDGCYIEPQNVLAWMPLPEPMKVESEDKE